MRSLATAYCIPNCKRRISKNSLLQQEHREMRHEDQYHDENRGFDKKEEVIGSPPRLNSVETDSAAIAVRHLQSRCITSFRYYDGKSTNSESARNVISRNRICSSHALLLCSYSRRYKNSELTPSCQCNPVDGIPIFDARYSKSSMGWQPPTMLGLSCHKLCQPSTLHERTRRTECEAH